MSKSAWEDGTIIEFKAGNNKNRAGPTSQSTKSCRLRAESDGGDDAEGTMADTQVGASAWRLVLV